MQSSENRVETANPSIDRSYVFFYSGCAIQAPYIRYHLHDYSELVAAAMASREAKFLWKFLRTLNIPAGDGSQSISLLTPWGGVDRSEFGPHVGNKAHGNRRLFT